MRRGELIIPNGDGVTRVPPYEKILEEARLRFEAYESTIDRLSKKVRELEDEAYADGKMAEMKAEVEASRRAMARGFSITDEEHEVIREWQKEHQLEAHGVDIESDCGYGGAIGGTWTYIFLPTSIGVIGEVQCSCGEKLTFRELG